MLGEITIIQIKIDYLIFFNKSLNIIKFKYFNKTIIFLIEYIVKNQFMVIIREF